MQGQPGTEMQESMQGQSAAELQEDGNVLLDVNNLSVGFYEENEWDYVVKNADFTVNKGEVLGIVGESGSGKSMTALAIMGLLKKHGRITSGQLLFEGKDLTKLTTEAYQRIRGFDISMVFQEPMTSLNPVMTVGHQVEEMLRIHGLTDANRYDELTEGAEQTGTGTAGQLTEGTEQKGTGTTEQPAGGTGQTGTETAEQPVKKNDSAYRKRCKERTLEALREAGLKEPAVIYGKYPHELSGGMRQRVMIAMAMICNPKLLIADEPTTALDVTIQAKILKLLKQMNKKHGTSIIFISHDLNIIRKMCDRVLVMYQGKIIEHGRVKEVFEAPKHNYTERLVQASLGMRYRSAVMKKMPAAETLSIVEGETKTERKPKGKPVKKQHMIDLRNVNVFYSEKGKNIFRPAGKKQVVDHVTFHINEGEIFGLVGESGCGKSSLAKAIVGLQKYVEGDIILDTESPCMVFQDPYGSLNPAKKIGWLLTEPLRMSGISMTKEEQERRVDEILTKVDLPLRYKKRYPADLSGGQRQRVAIALALILNQKLIILDEPVSALDVTVQEQILELLLRLRRDEGLSYLFISHDMQVIRKICDYVCVMYQGKIVENARTEEIFTNPQHEYTRKLIRAAE